MLNNISNFFSLVKGKRVKKTLAPNDMIAIGVRNPVDRADYQPAGIFFKDLEAQVGGLQTVSVDNITITGDGTPGNPLKAVDYLEKIVNLTSDQIKTLGTPIELLAAPGTNKYYIIDRIQIEYKFGTTAYIFPTSPTFYLDGCFDSYIIKTLLTGVTDSVCVINGNLRNTITVGSGSGSVQVITNRDVLNSNLIIGTPNGDNPTTGDGTIKIKIYYKIESI